MKDDWLIEEYRDGSTVHLAGYSGGADAEGFWGRLWLRFVAADGTETRREYCARQSSDGSQPPVELKRRS